MEISRPAWPRPLLPGVALSVYYNEEINNFKTPSKLSEKKEICIMFNSMYKYSCLSIYASLKVLLELEDHSVTFRLLLGGFGRKGITNALNLN